MVIREVFGRIDAQAGLPAVTEIVERWRPDVVLRESAELASLVAAERAGIPHVHVCIGMHEVVPQFAELRRAAGGARAAGRARRTGRPTSALDAEPVFSSVPRLLDDAAGRPSGRGRAYLRFHEPAVAVGRPALPVLGRPRAATGLRDLRLGRRLARRLRRRLPRGAGRARRPRRPRADDGRPPARPRRPAPWPANAHVEQWWPQGDVLAHAAAMVGHGGFGTTMGALAAGVPQVVVPHLHLRPASSTAAHVAAVGAGIAVEMGPGSVARARAPRCRACSTTRRTPSGRAPSPPRSPRCRTPQMPSPCWRAS